MGKAHIAIVRFTLDKHAWIWMNSYSWDLGVGSDDTECFVVRVKQKI